MTVEYNKKYTAVTSTLENPTNKYEITSTKNPRNIPNKIWKKGIEIIKYGSDSVFLDLWTIIPKDTIKKTISSLWKLNPPMGNPKWSANNKTRNKINTPVIE